MKWLYSFLSLLLVSVVSVTAFSLVVHADEPEASEVVEVSESTSIMQDDQEDAAHVEPIAPELIVEDIQDAQNESEASQIEIGYIESETEISVRPLSVEAGGEVTLADINYTLNSIFFCIVLCMACAFVFLICKMVYPLFRGGR